MNPLRRLSSSPGRVRLRGSIVFAAAVVASLGAFALNILLAEVHPSTAWGVTYGGVAAGLLALTLGYAVRRRMPRRGPGPARAWLQVHIYGGLLFLLLMLMHTGFRLPHGVLAWAMWLVSLYVVASGVVGLLLQQWLPAVLTSAFATEVNFARIPGLVETVRQRVEALVATCDDTVRRFYERDLAALLVAPQPRLVYFIDATGGIRTRVQHLDYLRRHFEGEESAKLDQLKSLVTNKLEMDAQYTLQLPLRLWLYGHVPMSMALGVLVAFHLYSVWYY